MLEIFALVCFRLKAVIMRLKTDLIRQFGSTVMIFTVYGTIVLQGVVLMKLTTGASILSHSTTSKMSLAITLGYFRSSKNKYTNFYAKFAIEKEKN